MKRQEGVTLIALAVTIIVMLILAGVSISTLTGNSGISKNAANARLQVDIARCVEWLIEDEYTTGQVISINGGWLI